MKTRDVLKAAYLLQLEHGFFTIESLSKKLGKSYSGTSAFLKKLQKTSYVKSLGKSDKRKTKYVIDDNGRKQFKVVLTAGTYDIIHTGHIKTLKEAKKRGDLLIVIVARDKTVEKVKGRSPVIPENQRKIIVQALKPVDLAILGSEKDFLEPIRKVRPDLIVLGRDQPVNKRKLEEDLKKNDLHCEVIRLRVWDSSPLAKTSKIIKKINEVLHTLDI